MPDEEVPNSTGKIRLAGMVMRCAGSPPFELISVERLLRKSAALAFQNWNMYTSGDFAVKYNTVSSSVMFFAVLWALATSHS